MPKTLSSTSHGGSISSVYHSGFSFASFVSQSDHASRSISGMAGDMVTLTGVEKTQEIALADRQKKTINHGTVSHREVLR
jgi:hypothetical protein